MTANTLSECPAWRTRRCERRPRSAIFRSVRSGIVHEGFGRGQGFPDRRRCRTHHRAFLAGQNHARRDLHRRSGCGGRHDQFREPAHPLFAVLLARGDFIFTCKSTSSEFFQVSHQWRTRGPPPDRRHAGQTNDNNLPPPLRRAMGATNHALIVNWSRIENPNGKGKRT